jgi:hypothetical protein
MKAWVRCLGDVGFLAVFIDGLSVKRPKTRI